ncbi:ABC transporter permease [Paraburkholderia sp. D1E]|uniref:ABC transporter permease n=1 Tax=Paraburkholderia sp. D1E TaxID=3461398 RepID=UPI00404585AE
MSFESHIPDLIGVVNAMLRVATPILLAGIGALLSERAGVINLGLEGTMLSSALAGVVVSAYTGSAALGLLGAIVVGAMLGALLNGAVEILRADLILSGVALNLAASAGTVMCLYWLTGDKGMSSSLHSKVLPNIAIPFVSDIPLIGPILSGRNIMTYVAFVSVPAVSLMLGNTTFGLRLRAAGQDPSSTAIAGVRVARIRLAALVLSGIFAGMAGAYLSMGYVSWFGANMSGGRGFIAIAAEVMGGGTAYGTGVAALVLGGAEAVAVTVQSYGAPSELIQAVPYLVPVIALAFYARQRQRRTATLK